MDKDRKLIIAGNWKMNKTVAEGLDLVQGLKRELANIKEVDIVVCPPFTSLSDISKAILDSNIRLGAQNMSEHNYGAYTGEIAAGMLKEFLVQQISVSDGKIFLLFHPESPVKVEKLLALIRKEKSRFRLSPDGRLSFVPKNQEWQPLMDEVAALLRGIADIPESQREPLTSVGRVEQSE